MTTARLCASYGTTAANKNKDIAKVPLAPPNT